MTPLSSCLKKPATVIAGTVAIAVGLWLCAGLTPVSAAPGVTAAPGVQASPVELVRSYRRHNPPVYPYYYSPGRPGGYSFYFGFMPYARGDYEIQALQREFPQTNYPPSMRYRTPQARDN
jgi:hypothetical protein